MGFCFSCSPQCFHYSVYGEKRRRRPLSSSEQVLIIKASASTNTSTSRVNKGLTQWICCLSKWPVKLYPAKCFSQTKQSTQQQQQDDDDEDVVEELEMERLFSNLNQVTLKPEPGSLTSAILLVSGTTVGAGILAIPAVTQESGFVASAFTCIFCWIFMVITGLLIAEVNVKTMCELGSGGVSLVSMARRTLGTAGVQIACWSYIFIHYALLVAYVARSSDILTNFLGIPSWESAALFSLFLGGICYFGSQRVIGAVNGTLIFGIITSLIALVVVASEGLHWDALMRANFEAVPVSIPIIALSFVYQNVVPVLCTNLEGNLSKVRSAIVVGTSIPLALFLVWDAVILGSIPTSKAGFERITDPLQQLRSTNGIVGPIIEIFSLLAIATSYIGFVLGLADFLTDLLNLPSGQSRPLPYVLSLIPPLILSLLDPDIFFKALDFAGTYGVLVLFGILPAAMSWSDRYSKDSAEFPKLPELVPGGKLTLSLVAGGAGFVIFSELVENFDFLLASSDRKDTHPVKDQSLFINSICSMFLFSSEAVPLGLRLALKNKTHVPKTHKSDSSFVSSSL